MPNVHWGSFIAGLVAALAVQFILARRKVGA